MHTEKEYRRKQLEKEAARKRASGAPEPERSYDAPLPSNISSRQKLDIANANFHLRGDGYVEPPLTDEERGMSATSFRSLSARRKIEIFNLAMFKRRSQQ